ncbi:MAG: hypothetical protein ABJA79_00945 [Parafilimonas sp.]
MEPEAKEFLQRVSFTLLAGLVWMAINSTAGIMYNYAFIEGKLRIGNIIFYVWLVVSFVLLLWFYIRLWKSL